MKSKISAPLDFDFLNKNYFCEKINKINKKNNMINPLIRTFQVIPLDEEVAKKMTAPCRAALDRFYI